MKYVDEFRSRKLIDKVAKRIRDSVDENRTYNIMEVCGTHTMSIFRYGLKDILPGNIKLISGPGCPVCVTPNSFLDKAICLSRLKDVTIATFGDMLKVPGSYSSLEIPKTLKVKKLVKKGVLGHINQLILQMKKGGWFA